MGMGTAAIIRLERDAAEVSSRPHKRTARICLLNALLIAQSGDKQKPHEREARTKRWLRSESDGGYSGRYEDSEEVEIISVTINVDTK